MSHTQRNSYSAVNRSSLDGDRIAIISGASPPPPKRLPSVPRRSPARSALLLSTPFLLGALVWLTGQHSEALVGLRKTHPLAADAYLYATANVRAAPYEVHPIRTLMEEAKSKWEDKKARQSTDYEGAVEEYKRRYQRTPPPGFKAWSVPLSARPPARPQLRTRPAPLTHLRRTAAGTTGPAPTTSS